MLTEGTLIGQGIVSWPSKERRGDRYGSITLWQTADEDSLPVGFDEGLAGRHGRLEAHVLETRQSDHIGDLFRGFIPETPEVGEVIVLGTGTLFFEDCYGSRAAVLQPDDGRKHDWLDPLKLYRAIHQTCQLVFVEDGPSSVEAA